jgi:hypothetical protein
MATTEETRPAAPLEIERLSRLRYLSELVQGIGIALGMGILWGLEIVRNAYFRLLDRLNLKPRRGRRASAFPPGRPKKRRQLRV